MSLKLPFPDAPMLIVDDEPPNVAVLFATHWTARGARISIASGSRFGEVAENNQAALGRITETRETRPASS